MKDIKAILEGIEIEDEAKSRIIEEVNANYRTIKEMDGKKERIAELEKANEELSGQIKALEGDGEEIESLKVKIAEFEQAEKDRKAKEQEAQRRTEFEAVFNAAVGDKEFSNDLIRETVFNKVYAACSATTGASAETVLAETVKDMDGVWKNPQHDVNKMPNQQDVSSGHKTDPAKDKDAKTLTDFLLGR